MRGRYRNTIADDAGAVPTGHGFTSRNAGPGDRPDPDEEAPNWFIPQQPGRRPPQGGGRGFSGASDPGGPSPRGDHGGGSGGSGGYGGGGGGGGSGGGGSGGHGGFGGFGGQGGSGGSGGSEEYEYGGRRRGRRLAVVIASVAGGVALILVFGVGAYVLAERAGDCSDKDAISLSVAASPDIAPAVTKTAARFNDDKNEVGGRCVSVAVRAAEPAGVSTMLTGQSGASNVGRPDVWIPDSSQWTALVRTSDKGKDAIRMTKTSVAQTPIVVAIPQALAVALKGQGATAPLSWETLLNAAAGGSAPRSPALPGKIQLYAPEPTRTGTGLVSLNITSTLLANKPEREALFTGIVRTVRESTLPTVDATFDTFAKGRPDRPPVALAPEQAVWRNYRRTPPVRAVAVYPREGTMSLDYPVVLTNSGDTDRRQAAQLLEAALADQDAQADVRELGFRSPDGKAPAGFGAASGVNPQPPPKLPAPSDGQVATVMQAWLKLSLSIRMLSLFDISGSMNEKVGPGINRMQATIRVAQGGVSLFPNDTELGTWAFSTKLVGNQDWREIVPMGALGDRIGSTTRRQLVLSSLGALKPKPNGDTGLYESVLAALRFMTRTYKPEFANSIMLLTDGKNDDPGGPSLDKTLTELRKIRNPARPVQVIMIGYGKGVDTNELQRIAEATDGSVHVALSPADVQKIFLRAVSRRTGG